MKKKLLLLTAAGMMTLFGTGAGNKSAVVTAEATAVVRPQVLKLPKTSKLTKVDKTVKVNPSEIELSLIKAQKRINFFTADFTLTVREKENNTIQLNANGQAWMANKRRYHVQYQKPKKQTLVSNGKKRWLYLEEINQVQVQAMPPEGNPTEFFLELGGGLNRLLGICTATVEKKEHTMIYTLIPKVKSNANFEQAIIWTKGENKIPFKLEVIGEKIVRVDFSKIKTKLDNQKLTRAESSLFTFILPKDAEVIEMLWPMQ